MNGVDLAEWLSRVTGEKYFLGKNYVSEDIEALRECFKIFLGEFSIDRIKKMNNHKELRKVFENYDFDTVLRLDDNSDGLEHFLKIESQIQNYRKDLTGYILGEKYRSRYVQSVNTRFKDYSFSIWHGGNTQIFVCKADESEYIRIERESLYQVIYEYFNDLVIEKRKTVQTSLF